MASSGERPPQEPHFLLIPLMAQGHMIPMADIAQLLAARGVAVSVISTPLNAGRLKPSLDLAAERGHRPIRLIEIPFPCREAGLPDGCENLDLVPTKEMIINFFVAVGMLRKPVEELVVQGELRPPPTCIVSDMGLHWTGEVARKAGIPRFTFHGTCCFSLLCSINVRRFNVLESLADDEEAPFTVPGLPHRIEITRAHMPNNLAPKNSMQGLQKEIRDAEAAAHGIIVNSFQELEAEYVDLYQEAVGKKAWTIGPVALCSSSSKQPVNPHQSDNNRNVKHNAQRGNRSSIDDDKCSAWLDSMKPRSVVYVSFGTLVRQTPEQLIEIGLGLEASGSPFIWVVKAGERASEFEAWVTEHRLEERNSGRCLIIRGWAPQLLILSHPAVGGFLTHCGWNSSLEGIAAGVPMITWPLFAEQFLNEKLLVEVLHVGVSLGVKTLTKWHDEEATGVLAGRTDVEKAVRELMDEGQDGEDRRNRAKELGEKARRAMQHGGSSDLNLSCLIQDVSSFAAKTTET